jgi:hypothetical protein
MKVDDVLRGATLLTLLGILAVLIAIHRRMPLAGPTYADLRNPDVSVRRDAFERQPIVRVSGTVGVDGFVTVDGSVTVDNDPLPVTIVPK